MGREDTFGKKLDGVCSYLHALKIMSNALFFKIKVCIRLNKFFYTYSYTPVTYLYLLWSWREDIFKLHYWQNIIGLPLTFFSSFYPWDPQFSFALPTKHVFVLHTGGTDHCFSWRWNPWLQLHQKLHLPLPGFHSAFTLWEVESLQRALFVQWHRGKCRGDACRGGITECSKWEVVQREVSKMFNSS